MIEKNQEDRTHYITVRGARENNLQNLSLHIPKGALVGISGPSGSGKSSLAFETIFAEGQRRYVESLSSYARQFLGRMHKPEVDAIEGLSPAISIEQKTTHNNPRSTVGTITEIYDYYRLLFARVGRAYCPQGHGEIRGQSLDQIIGSIQQTCAHGKIMILAPLVDRRKGEHHKLFQDAREAGFSKVRVNGVVEDLENTFTLAKNQRHTIEVVVDRLVLEDNDQRLAQSLEKALSVAPGKVLVVSLHDNTEKFFSERHACPQCGYSLPEIEPRLFSFNSPYGACQQCNGLGARLSFDLDRIVPDKTLAVKEAILVYQKSRYYQALLEALSQKLQFSLETAYQDLPGEIQKILVYGYSKSKLRIDSSSKRRASSYSSWWRGILPDLERRYKDESLEYRSFFEHYMTKEACHACQGARLKPEALCVQIHSHTIASLAELTVGQVLAWFQNFSWEAASRTVAEPIVQEILSRLQFMQAVGLAYLSLDRQAQTLSGGESQRIRLASQIGSALTGVLYVLDEPTIGLHQRDNQRLIVTLQRLRDLGNTLLVVEHDEQLLLSADHLIDIGPGAGIHGGKILAQGSLREFLTNPQSLTAPYLTHEKQIPLPKKRRPFHLKTGNVLKVCRASHNNLQGLTVAFPVACLNVITGVSGSGKSTLLNDVIYPYVANRLQKLTHLKEGAVERIEGIEYFDKVIAVDQSPIGRTPHSNPGTYVEVFTPIRELFASLHDSRVRGYLPGRFSFNVKGGRCEACRGYGVSKIEMHFLPDVYVTCEVCQGKRYNKETLEIRYRERNIHDVLMMSVEEARSFFHDVSRIRHRLQVLESVGLGYIKLGQSSLTLSGGEAQRVKLAYQLAKKNTGKTLYIIDEPTTGLHFIDIEALMQVLHRLVDLGNTVIMIEHNLDVVKQADYLVDLGPDGGPSGGSVVAQGRPEEVAKKDTFTAVHLREVLQSHKISAQNAQGKGNFP